MTVYRRFGDKAGLVQALVARECRRLLATMDAASTPEDPIAEQVAAGFATAVRLAREHPLLRTVGRHEPETVLDALSSDGGGLLILLREYLAGRLREAMAAGVMAEIDVEPVAELLVRIALSFVLLPESALPLEDEQALRTLARRALAPMLTAQEP
jgi:AcrR family transcriptional regulator